MSKRLSLSALAALLLAGCNSGPSSGNTGPLSSQARQGQRIFKLQCAVCHNADSTATLHGPGLKGLFHRQALPSGIPVTDDHVRMTIRNGRAMMPPFGNILDEEQVDDLLAYLRTL